LKRSILGSLIAIVLMAVGGLAATIAVGNTPKLGLDLQGGAYVVLRPAHKVDTSVLEQSIRIIRSRVDALGVAEPDISRQGSSIVIQLPGVKDQKRALDLVGQTAELRFRPVLGQLPVTSSTTTTNTTTASSTTTTTVAPDAGTTSTTSTTIPDITPRDQDLPDQQVILPEVDKQGTVTARYALGPALATGTIVKTAKAVPPQLAGNWSVTVTFTGSGSKKFDEIASLCYSGAPQCPAATGGRGRLAIVLDGIVKSSPAINAQTFNGTAEITGNFSEREAKDLALVLRFGALPVQLTPQTSQTVSATLGKDSLRAGITAGLIGLALVLLYMILYYRALGLVVVFGLSVSGMLLYTLVCYLGTKGLALTLAGTVGVIVSVGVTVDSYVVYFERLKDEIRSGKTIRSSVDRGFARAYRTILAADASSFIGAVLLYLLTVGSVRGFAFFLGVSTLLDVITAYFFTRPMVILLGRNRVFTEAPFLGVARGLAAGGTTS
jgi:preprotein translocase subunit SecD